MNLIKIANTETFDTQIYFVDYLGEFIIVNFDYGGLLVLNQKLEKIRAIDIFDDFVIEKVYFNNGHDTALILCQEQNCFVLVNELFDVTIINLNEESADIFFSDLYYWSEKEILISSYSGDIYSISLENNKFEKTSSKYVQTKYPSFFAYWKLTSKLGIEYYDIKNGLIYNNGDYLTNYSHTGENKININLRDENFEIAAFNKYICLIFNENTIEIHYNDQGYELTVDSLYMYRSVRFLSKEKLIILLTNKSDPFENTLTLYTIK